MFRVALAQIASIESKEENLNKICKIIEDFGKFCDLILFPEYSMAYSKPFNRKFVERVAESIDGPFLNKVRETAREIEVHVAVNIHEKRDEKVFNSTVLIGDKGEIKAVYRKIHLFDAFKYRESKVFSPGEEVVVAEVHEATVGFEICYDIRFPELARILALKGAKIIAVSAGWYRGPLKEEQWFTLLKARAHENGVFVVACCHAGEDFTGRSIAVDPLGYVIMDLGIGEKVAVVDLDLSRVEEVRKIVPAIYQRKPNIYRKYGLT